MCRAKLRAAGAPDALFEQPVGARLLRQLEQLAAFAERSETGDRSELDARDHRRVVGGRQLHERRSARARPTAPTATSASPRRHATARTGVDILVVNHALYCAHLASDGNVLPEHDLVILDEAHAFADNATNAFGADLAPDALDRPGGHARPRGRRQRPRSTRSRDAGQAPRRRRSTQREGTVDVGARRSSSATRCSRPAERLATASAKLVTAGDDYAQADRRGSRPAGSTCCAGSAAPGDDDVVWIERVGRNAPLRIAPVAAGETIGALACSHDVR